LQSLYFVEIAIGVSTGEIAMPKYYAGIGSRETPPDILALMTDLARAFAIRGWTLRSGAADGADAAFEAGATEIAGSHGKEIYLPWKGFNGHSSTLLPSKAAFVMAEKFHPAWHKCSPAARKLHARNCHQVLGQDLKTPSMFVMCWTKKAEGGGGTGQAIRIAKAYGIHIHDLADPATLRRYRGMFICPESIT
jgi:hypothetical protein